MIGSLAEPLVARIAHHGRVQPDEPALVFFRHAAPVLDVLELTWAGLATTVQQAGALLCQAGVKTGDVLFVLSREPAEQAVMFLGAMAAGALPSILSFPSLKQSEAQFHQTLRPIADSTGARWIVTSRELLATVTGAGLAAQAIEMPALEALGGLSAVLPEPASAFLQFSSGTTGLRKCVRIDGAMLAQQAASYSQFLGLGSADCIASWLPLYHDMGLVACLLIPLLQGLTSVHISPFAWLKEPALLFQAAARYRATLVWLPNFAYKLCADTIADRDLAGLDLSALRAIINCSEPVRPAAHEVFARRFAGLGIRMEHLHACYAMAEATFAVTQTRLGTRARLDRLDASVFAREHRAVPAAPNAPDESCAVFVSCGQPIDGIEVMIAGSGPEGSPERHVGEILIRGACVISGYGVDSSGRQEAFADGGWYRTGDLGYLAAGELYVTGRAKDLIIHRGHNIYPTDVEEVVAGLGGVKPGRLVVFGLYHEAEGTEHIVLMLEPDGTVEPALLRRRVREEIWLKLNVAITDIDLCEPGTLRKSTSGKLSRSGNRQLYQERQAQAGKGAQEAGSRPAGGPAEPRDLWERQLAWIWEEILGVVPIRITDNLFLELGADSVATMRAAAEVQRRLEQAIEPTVLLSAPTIERQAALLRDQEQAGQGRGSLVTLERSGTGIDLFLVHAAGGWAFPYVTLVRHLGGERPIHAFQAPQLRDGNTAGLTMERMAADYIAALKQVKPHGPYVLAGWSFGGLVAYEMARHLRAAGDTVLRVIMFDSAPPLGTKERIRRQVMAAVAGRLFQLGLRWPALRKRIPALRQVEALTPVWRFFAAYMLTGEEADIGPAIAFAFPDTCDRQRLATLDARAAWDYAIELALANPAPADRTLLIPGLDGQGALRALRVSRLFEQLFVGYEPAGAYPGDVDIVAVRGNSGLERWRQYVSGRLVIHPFDLESCFISAHWDLMEEVNVRRFAPELRRMLAALDREAPAPG